MELCIFDMGGVVCSNTRVGPLIIQHLGISSAEFYRLAAKAQIQLLETGKITAEEFWQHFGQEFGREIEEDLWQRFFQPIPIQGTIEIITQLKKQVRVVVGTNTIASHYQIHQQRGDYDLFNAVYASHQMGLAKPNLEFYQRILKSEGYLDPSQVVFIDDSLANVRAAEEAGLQGIHFSSPEELAVRLPWNLSS